MRVYRKSVCEIVSTIKKKKKRLDWNISCKLEAVLTSCLGYLIGISWKYHKHFQMFALVVIPYDYSIKL